MTHPRKIIRQAVAKHIRDGETLAAERVWASREPPVNVETVLMDQGPVILVYTRKDIIKPEDYPVDGQDGAVRRTLELAVEITAVGADVVDDKLDDLAEQVEELLEAFEVPSMPATEIRLESSEIETSTEFEQPLGGAFMLYEVKYWKAYRPDDDDEEWNACGGTLSVVPHMNGTQSGAPEVIASCDCDEEEP